MTNFLEYFGRMFFPEKWREPIRQYLLKAGYEHVPYDIFGLLFFVAIGITYALFVSFLLPELGTSSPFVVGVASFFFWIVVLFGFIAIVSLGGYFVLNMRIYARVKEMEALLPEYLQLVVTNLRSGMNFEQSLWAAARPEFGILAAEITLVSKKVMTGNDTAEALMEFVERYDSATLRRNFQLIISELQSGGEIAKVIERVIGSLKKTKDLKEEMSASVLNFMIFISVIVIVLAPILFALANTLLSVVLSFAELLSTNVGASSASLGSAGSLITKMTKLAANGEVLQALFRNFSYWAIGLIAFFSSMIVSIIEKGDIRGGIRYIPLFVIASLVVFGFAFTFFNKIFSGFVGG